MWKFIECLKLEQALADQKITDYLNRLPPPRRLPKWIEYDKRLSGVIEAYDKYSGVMQYHRIVAGLS